MVTMLFDEEYRMRAAIELAEARKDIRIMMFRMQKKIGYGKQEGNIYTFWMKKKVTQGVKVRILLDITRRPGMPNKQNFLMARELTNAGVECRELKRIRVCHAKVVIIDERTMIVGSHNWTTNSIKRNLEVSILVKDHIQVITMVEKFDRIFADAVKFK